jgi:hypothetical protein
VSPPFSAEELRVLQAEWDAEARALHAPGAPAVINEAALRAFAHRADRVLMPIMLGTAATLGAVCLVAQIVKWIGA